MLTIILFAGVVAVVAFLIVRDAFLATMFGIVGILVGAVFSLALGDILPKIDAPQAPISLVAMHNESGGVGSFFLGTGYIGNEEYLFYMYQTPDEGYKRGQISLGDGVTIYEREQNTAEMVVVPQKFAQDWYNLFTAPRSLGTSYRFYVPKGTVVQGFSIK